MNRYLFYFLVLLGLAFRILLATHYDLVNGGDVDVYLADEGVVGLMGKHILEGRELPVFFYGQHYLGALEAYAAALGFAFLGVSFFALRVVLFCFSAALALAVYSFTYRFYSVAAARCATALIAVGPMYFLQWNLKARGGFIEHLVLLLLMMLYFWRFFLHHQRHWRVAVPLGLIAGVALWVNQLVLSYLFVMAALLLSRYRDRRGWMTVAVAGLLGASLLISYNVVYPAATLKALARKALVVNRVPVEQRDEDWLTRGVMKRVEALSDGVSKLGLVFGIPPSPDIERLGIREKELSGGVLSHLRRSWSFIPLLVFGWAVFAGRPRRGRTGWDPPGSDQLLAAFFLVTVAVGYVSPRYMLAAYPIAAILAGVLVTRLSRIERGLMGVGVGLVLIFNVASWADALISPSESTQQRGRDLLELLDRHQLTACYSAAPLYHLVFASQEKVILAPLQKDRYAPYNRIVENSDSICYVFRDDQVTKRQHLAFMSLLEHESVSFKRDRSGEYQVLYDFSPRSAISKSAIEKVKSQERAALQIPALPEL